jgi:hypothetical protein
MMLKGDYVNLDCVGHFEDFAPEEVGVIQIRKKCVPVFRIERMQEWGDEEEESAVLVLFSEESAQNQTMRM